MMAMEAATNSAKDMLHELDIMYNRARQAAITQEDVYKRQGYDYNNGDDVLVPNKDAETVRKIFALYKEGYSCLLYTSIPASPRAIEIL